MGTRKNISVDHFDKTIDDLKETLRNEQRKLYEEMANLIKELKNDLQEEKIKTSKLADKVAVLTKQVSVMKKALSQTSLLAVDNEQYSRRQNLIIKNIQPAGRDEKESAEDCLNKVKAAIGGMDVVLSAHAIDRAH